MTEISFELMRKTLIRLSHSSVFCESVLSIQFPEIALMFGHGI